LGHAAEIGRANPGNVKRGSFEAAVSRPRQGRGRRDEPSGGEAPRSFKSM
jgi:hypothetical protein